MSSEHKKARGQNAKADGLSGLFRTLLAGPGHTLAEAFANLEHTPSVELVARHAKRDLFGARVALAPEEGEGYWEFTRVRDDIFVIIENFSYKDPRVELVPGDELIQFYFKLSGDLTLGVGRTESLRLDRPSLLVYSQPRGFDISEWTAPSARERCVAVSVRPDFLRDHFLVSATDSPPQLQAFVNNDRAQINFCQIKLTAQMFEIATRMVNNKLTGSLALVRVEALAMDLLCSAIESFSSLSGAPSEQYTQRELRCLNKARERLMRELSPPPTIRQLARFVGMNETALKAGFKATFGETISAFSVRCRMQHALTLLREHRAPVARAAQSAGYRHQTSFATAFFRHFGIRPKDVRRGSPR